MLLTIQPAQIEQLAPNDNSIKAAKKLAKLSNWNARGAAEDQWVWGEIQGSSIYQSAIYLPELKCECSCPSFKRPCKHALALLFVYADYQDQFPLQNDENHISSRVQSWRTKISKKIEKKAEPAKAVDPAARAKRQQAREKKMEQGLQALEQWLHDVVNLGLGQMRNREGERLIREISSRLVDAQAAGLNSWINEFSSALYQENWQQKSQFWLAKLHWACKLWQQRAVLPSETQQELLHLLGVSLASEVWQELPLHPLDLYSLANISQTLTGDRTGEFRRQWLWDAEKLQDHVLIDFKIMPHTQYGITLRLKQKVQCQAQFYPSRLKQRLSLDFTKLIYQNVMTPPAGFQNFAQAFSIYANKLAQFPLHSISFWWMENLRFYYSADGNCTLIDQNNQVMPLQLSKQQAEILWLNVYNQTFYAGLEWNGLELKLLSIWQGENYLCL